MATSSRSRAGDRSRGTFNFAERVRQRIGALRIPRLDGKGAITVATSCGVTAAPPVAADERMLRTAADGALRGGKSAGKNTTIRAEEGLLRR